MITKTSILNGLLAVVVTSYFTGTNLAHAAKVYKWVDENGIVTYRDRPPKADVDESLEVKEIDSQKNVIEYAETPVDPKTEKSDKNSDRESLSSLKDGNLKDGIPPTGKYTKEELKEIARRMTVQEYVRKWMPLIEEQRRLHRQSSPH